MKEKRPVGLSCRSSGMSKVTSVGSAILRRLPAIIPVANADRVSRKIQGQREPHREIDDVGDEVVGEEMMEEAHGVA